MALPAPAGTTVESLRDLLTQWKGVLDRFIQAPAEPLLVPRNARCETPVPNVIRLRWDPGSLNTDGYDVSYAESADFAHHQSHRVTGHDARYFDLVVEDAKRRYFRVRAFKGEQFSRWSNIAAAIADIPVAAVAAGNPGTVNFTPTVAGYGFMSFKDFTLSGKADILHVVVWYIDEPAIQYLYGVFTSSFDDSASTPTVGANIFSRFVDGVRPEFAQGDLVAVNDPDQDPGNTTFRKYELMKLGTITGTQPGAVSIAIAGRAELGSFKAAHNAGRRFFKVKAKHYVVPCKDNAGHDRIINEEDFPLASGCVVAMAVAAAVQGTVGTYLVKNCSQLAYPFPGNLKQRNPAPGFRTCTGAEYTIPLVGGHLQGQTCPVRINVAENASPRCAVAKNTVAPLGTIAVYNGVLGSDADVAEVAYVLYVEPLLANQEEKNRRVAVLEQLAYKNGEFASFPPTDVPDFRRMPYRLEWPFELPVIGTLDSLFDPDLGSLRTNALPFITTGETLWLEEGGDLDGVIARAGATVPGSHMTLTVLT